MILLGVAGRREVVESPSQLAHKGCAAALLGAEGPLLLSPFVLAELDYLVGKLVGLEDELALLDEVAREAYELVSFGPADVERARQIIERYADHKIGLADASLVVLSERFGTNDLLSLDERHFRVLRGAGGAPFRILPADDPQFR